MSHMKLLLLVGQEQSCVGNFTWINLMLNSFCGPGIVSKALTNNQLILMMILWAKNYYQGHVTAEEPEAQFLTQETCQGHTAGKCHSLSLNPRRLTPDSMPLTTTLLFRSSDLINNSFQCRPLPFLFQNQGWIMDPNPGRQRPWAQQETTPSRKRNKAQFSLSKHS